MTTTELEQIRAGDHWLCRLAEEINADVSIAIRNPGFADKTPAEIALQWIAEKAEAENIHQGAKITVRCYPWEKSRIIRAAKGEKLEDWTRKTLIEKAFSETE